jgi:hypothetical protein
MAGSHDGETRGSTRDRLLDVIGSVRSRWRAKIVLRGLLITCTPALPAVVAIALLAQRTDMSGGVLLGLALACVAAIGALAVRHLAIPLRRRVTDEQVALYLEEHEPTLQSTLISALEGERATISPAFAQRTLEAAIEKCRAIEDGRRVDRAELGRFATAFSAVALIGVGMTLFGPALLRSGADALLSPLRADSGARI